MAKGYFNIKRDNELIAAGTHFWCEGHSSATPVDDMSQDSRYCLSCYAILKVEAEMQPTKKVARMPKNISCETAPAATEVASARQEVVTEQAMSGILPHAGDVTDINSFILQNMGKSTRKIAKELANKGINISHMTIARRIKKAQGILL